MLHILVVPWPLGDFPWYISPCPWACCLRAWAYISGKSLMGYNYYIPQLAVLYQINTTARHFDLNHRCGICKSYTMGTSAFPGIHALAWGLQAQGQVCIYRQSTSAHGITNMFYLKKIHPIAKFCIVIPFCYIGNCDYGIKFCHQIIVIVGFDIAVDKIIWRN